MMNERLPLEQELYEAWVAYYEMTYAASEEEAGAICARCNELYERAYEELGPRWTQEILRDARQDTGDDI
jgi:hypothetical protein